MSKYITLWPQGAQTQQGFTVWGSGMCRSGGHVEAPAPGQGGMEGWARETSLGGVLKHSCEGRVGRRPFKSGFQPGNPALDHRPVIHCRGTRVLGSLPGPTRSVPSYTCGRQWPTSGLFPAHTLCSHCTTAEEASSGHNNFPKLQYDPSSSSNAPSLS